MGDTLLAAPPESEAVVSAVFQIMLSVAGMRMRMSCAAVMLGVAASVIVIALMAVAACPTTNSWFAAATIVGCTTWIVRPSLAAVPPPDPETTSSRLSAAEGAAKLVYCSPETVTWSPPAKSVVTLRTSVFPPSS